MFPNWVCTEDTSTPPHTITRHVLPLNDTHAYFPLQLIGIFTLQHLLVFYDCNVHIQMTSPSNPTSTQPPVDRDDHADIHLSYMSHKRQRVGMTPMGFESDEPHEGGHHQHTSSGGEKADSAGDGASSDKSSSSSSKQRPHLSESDVSGRCFARGNHIYYFSGVSKDSVYRLKDCLQNLNNQYRETKRKNPELKITPKPIYLHINSFGGGVFAAFAAIDFIQQSEIPVHTIIEGASASAATLMSVVGAKRYIRPHASMLIHQLSSWFGGKLTEIEDDYQNIQQMHETIKDIYKKHTKLSDNELEQILKHDLWWKAGKCIETGLVDEVWEGKD